RRRHTRSYGDWSSDVCSSDLDLKSSLGHVQERVLLYRLLQKPWGFTGVAPKKVFQGTCTAENFASSIARAGSAIDTGLAAQFLRSEERRVGKECGSRWVA